MLDSIPKVKYPPMNEIHEKEAKVLDDLLEALENDENVKDKFEIFFDDVKHHFKFEEDLMDKYNFFAKIPHKMEHDKVIKELEQVRDFDNENMKKYFYEKFIPWLENHILTIDTVTAGYFDMVE